LATHIPADTWAATSDGLLAAFCPVLNIVARIPLLRNALSSVVVLPALGPSS
jgi:hypothetical protein